MTLRLLGSTLLLVGIFSTFAHGDDFYFTMNGTASSYSYLYPDLVPGTLTGEIVGLQDNATSLPTEVIIDSVPSYPDGYWNLPQPFDNGPMAANDGFTATGGFTVTDGQITAAGADFNYQPVGFGGERAAADLEFDYGGYNQVSDSGYPEPYMIGDNGFAGVTYTLAAVPEPSRYGLLFLGAMALFAGKGFFRARYSV
jgi:hypothetical protein